MTEVANFRYTAAFPCSVESLYNWHSRKGALERLIPPWEKTEVRQRRGGLDPGGMVEMRMHAGPVPFRWIAHHVENVPGAMFRDVMHKGPFSHWSHRHRFYECDKRACLEDSIEYALPLHGLLPSFLQKHVDTTLQRTFQHRAAVLAADLELHRRCGTQSSKVLVSGASGVLGRALLPLLTTGGHEVWTLVRRKPNREENELYWNPMAGKMDDLPYFDAVIHLAGEYIGLGRWNTAKKKAVLESRTRGTTLLAGALAAQTRQPKVFLCASAVGYYGDTSSATVDENSSSGDGFIAEVCRKWEDAAQVAAEAGIRTVLMRIGVALSPQGGALQRLLSTAPLGIMRRFGRGDQFISWISLDDTISAIYHAMCCPALHGPVNMTAPFPVCNSSFMEILSEISGYPLLFPVPESYLKAVYGQMATEIVLSSSRTDCRKLLDSGFIFRHRTLEEALCGLLGKFGIDNGSTTSKRREG
ncbi:MAG: TIGR01777 family oxidoreductase [Desulfopila sp.]|jgi:uncharacterized protein (TIGR01777 family)|nr:TIGR01777 family oxidoreductase [Desulfopila sp.]